MATIELTIPAGKLDRVIHGLCATAGIAVEDESAAEAKTALIRYIKRAVWRIETQEAEAAVAIIPDDGLVS